MCQIQLGENWCACKKNQGHLSTDSEYSQPASQLTVTSKSIFQLTLFAPAAAFSISIQVTNRFSCWCITGFMTEFSGECCMWPWHISAGILRCQRADLRHQTCGDVFFIFQKVSKAYNECILNPGFYHNMDVSICCLLSLIYSIL